MKFHNIASSLALILSVVALILALRTRTMNSAQLDAEVAKTVTKRELEIVHHYQPHFRKMYREMAVDHYEENPRTIEGLLAPLFVVWTEMNR